MYCVMPDHEDLSEEELKGEKNEATHLVTVKHKPPRSAQYLLVCCKRCAFRTVGRLRGRTEFWDRVPRESGEPWVHMVVFDVE